MANQEHLHLLSQGIDTWNTWRDKEPELQPDLSRANLSGANLSKVNFSKADLSFTFLNHANLDGANLSDAKLYLTIFANASLMAANLSGSDLSGAVLSCAILVGANLRSAYLLEANLSFANFFQADLTNANLLVSSLTGANFNRANLSNADFRGTQIGWTTFGDIDLRTVKGLDKVNESGPFTIGLDTIVRSQGNISTALLRNAGVPDDIITYVHSLVNNPIDYYTCFISYSSQDEDFAKRLYADLQSKGVRCWYAPEDLKIGDKFRQRIEDSIRLYDKLLLVLSESSLASTWVAYEVEKALNKEPEGVPNVLFPIRLDTTILTSGTDWAKEIRRSRHIGDFEHWKNHDIYQRAFQRLLQDLKAQS